MSAALQLGPAERGFLYAVGRRYVRDPDAADEVAQDAMLLAHRHRDAFRGDSHPHTWLYRIATTTAFDYLRRHPRRAARQAAVATHVAETREAVPSAESALATHERVARITRELGELDDKYAAVMRLRIEELCDREIAAKLGITVGTVKIRVHRARSMLRAALAEEEAA